MSDFNIRKGPFVICKAAAGSGKTFTLVKEYLKLAMAGGLVGIDTRFRGILAITFTNKAANEMKSRIMDYLDEVALHGADPALSKMGTPLLDALNEDRAAEGFPRISEAQLKEMARRLRSAILHRYSDLAVCTIDSFMHRVVRTFAHDLDKPVNFEVMIEKDKLIEQAVNQLMALVGTEGHDDLTAAVHQFAVSRMEEEKGFDIVQSLTDLAGQLFAEGTEAYLEQLARYSIADYMEIYRRYEVENKAFEHSVTALGAEAMKLIASAGLTVDQCARGKTGFFTFFDKMAHFAATLRNKQTVKPNRWVVELFGSSDYGPALLCKGKDAEDAATSIAPRLKQIYTELERLLDGPLVDYNTRRLLQGRLYAMALLGELNRQLGTYAKDNEVVHLSEFNRLINKVVQEEPAPFIYERLGNKYHHFLIDEFQDTSVLQWQNLVPLLENGVGQGDESLVVGDGKQAIYRFRQGDVRQFVALPRVEGMPLHGDSLSQPGNYQVMQLDTNYRTADAVVQFNNDFFSWLVRNHYADNELARKIYLGPEGDSELGKEELRQHVDEGNPLRKKGCVGLRFVDDDRDAICAEVLKIVNMLISERGYQARDIMILGRTRGELAAVGSYLLAHSDVEQSSAESFYLRSSLAVMTVVAALRCLRDSSDRVAAADLLNHLFLLGILRSPHDEAFLADSFDLQALLASEGVAFHSGQLLSMDLYDCCEEIVRGFRIDQLDVAYVASLLNKAAAFSSHHNQNLADFLDWFDEHPDLSVASSSEGDAVRLMTIHKAKGLEAPVVICPFFNTGTRPTGIWVNAAERFATGDKTLSAAYVTLSASTSTRFDADRDREKESSAVDNLNILYVAFTRPKELLFAVCPQPAKGDTAPTYSRLLYEYSKGQADYGDADFRHQAKESSAVDSGEVTLRRLAYGDWTSKVMIASHSQKALDSLQDERIRFGNHAHALLATVVHAPNMQAAVDRFVRQEKIGDDERQRLEALAHEVVSHPATARFFDPAYRVKNECDLTDGTHPGRPDRVVFTPDETWVVDFKTGHDLVDEYNRQVSRYCRTIAAMGYPRVSGWLVFLQPAVSVRQVVWDAGDTLV